MTNHVHLAIRTGAAPLSKIMAGLHASYAEWFNRRHRRVGHLFQGRYKAFLVQEDRYLHALLRYIHHNPSRARLVRRPSDYPWSSDRFLRAGRGPKWLDVDRLLSLLEASRRAAVRRYVALVDGPAASPSYETLRVVEQVVVGDDAFAAERLKFSCGPEPPLTTLSLEQVLDFVARETGVPVAVLAGPRRTRAAATARCLAAYLARRLCRIPIRRVARRLGRDDSAFARPLARLEDELTTDANRRRRTDELVQCLRQEALRMLPALSRHPHSHSATSQD